ncbi:uncharacterized protein [Apostichopus japonicus]|uniref:uncharacterized protein n=1 Tax=Stichopus japonicus TaxID=307972 RepID=UPI003AB61E1C
MAGRLIFRYVCVLLTLFTKFNRSNCSEDNGESSNLQIEEARLVNGGSDKDGLLQILVDNRWLHVCRTGNKDYRLAVAICNSLGYPYVCQSFDSGIINDVDISQDPLDVIDEVFCPPSTSSIHNCTIARNSNISCEEGYLGLVCSEGVNDVEVRLINGTLPGNGVVEIRCSYVTGWMRICAEAWDLRDGNSICRTLGYPWSAATTGVENRRTDLTLIKAVYCSHTDEHFLQCERDLENGCFDDEVALLDCGEDITVAGKDVRTCGARHSCSARCGEIRSLDSCSCDKLCYFYRDCCHDFEDFCFDDDVFDKPRDVEDNYLEPLAINEHLDFKFYKCEAVNFDQTFYLVSYCSPRWTDEELRQLCEDKSIELDPMRIMPVYDPRNISYKNVFCAVCHGVELNEAVPWEISAEYDRTRAFYDPYLGTVLPGILTGNYYFYYPSKLSNPRPCILKEYSKCSDKIPESNEAGDVCASYNAPVFPSDGIYKNSLCLICENSQSHFDFPNFCRSACATECTDNKYLKCNGLCGFTDTILSISLLFDFGSNTEVQERLALVCPPNEIYDIFSKRCRRLTCPSFSSCIAEPVTSGSPDDQSRNISEEIVLSCVLNITRNYSKVFNALDDVEPFHFSLTKTFSSIEMEVFGENILIVIAIESSLRPLLLNTPVEDPTCFTDKWRFVFEPTELPFIADRNCTHFIDCTSTATSTNRMKNPLCKVIYATYNYDKETHVMTYSIIPNECLSLLDRELQCNENRVFIPYDGLSVTDWNEPVVKHVQSSSLLRRIEIEISPDGVWACSENIVTEVELILYHIETVFGGLSIVALLCMIAIHICHPSLMNIQGKCIVVFTACLLLGQAFFKINPLLNEISDVCFVLATVSHFVWLSAFSWMTVIAFRITKTFTQSLRVHEDKSESLLLLALVAFGAPTPFVTVAIVLQFTNSSYTPYTSSTLVCYLRSGWPLVVFVTIPNVLFLLTTSVLLTVTILSVHRSLKAGRKVKSSNKQQTDELFIIVKLTILLGLPWILSLLQGIFNNVYLLWVSVIVNSLQGVLMLATFLLTPSVRKILRIPRCSQKNAVPTKEGTKAKKELNNTSTITTKL